MYFFKTHLYIVNNLIIFHLSYQIEKKVDITEHLILHMIALHSSQIVK